MKKITLLYVSMASYLSWSTCILISSPTPPFNLNGSLDTNNTVRICWFGETNTSYSLLFSTALAQPINIWKNTTDALGTNGPLFYTGPATAKERFYAARASTNPLYQIHFYIDTTAPAALQQKTWAANRPDDANQMAKIASQPRAFWLFGSPAEIGPYVKSIYAKIYAAQQTNINTNSENTTNATDNTNSMVVASPVPIFVVYNIPFRDCGGLSSGGASSGDTYLQWITNLCSALNTNRAVAIVEPDALSGMDCINKTNQLERIALIGQCVHLLKTTTLATVYLDVGHARWQSAAIMATRLKQADSAEADGFSLNISNFISDSETITYALALSHLLVGAHFIIDSSRNGLGQLVGSSGMMWCNPPGRALGRKPTTENNVPFLDAFLWIKYPGESDGTCNAGPSAGSWWPEYALGLAQRASY